MENQIVPVIGVDTGLEVVQVIAELSNRTPG
jgi:hypothetical protein